MSISVDSGQPICSLVRSGSFCCGRGDVVLELRSGLRMPRWVDDGQPSWGHVCFGPFCACRGNIVFRLRPGSVFHSACRYEVLCVRHRLVCVQFYLCI
jgi:hypothetical protein